jgi:hypothetical protein
VRAVTTYFILNSKCHILFIMPEVFFGSVPVIIFGLVAVVAVALYVREYMVRRRLEKDSHVSDQDKANFQTIQQLTDTSHTLVNQAKSEAQRMMEESKVFSEKTTQDFSQQLSSFIQEEEKQTGQAATFVTQDIQKKQAEFESFIAHLTSVLDNKTEASVKEFASFLENLKQESQKSQAANWEGAKTRVNELFESFETKLADFLLQTEQKMMLSVDLELKSARQLIDTYKVQQMNIIDENIVSMLEKTLSLVLAKNLSLKDQMDLVYDSLERAKTDSFLV